VNDVKGINTELQEVLRTDDKLISFIRCQGLPISRGVKEYKRWWLCLREKSERTNYGQETEEKVDGHCTRVKAD